MYNKEELPNKDIIVENQIDEADDTNNKDSRAAREDVEKDKDKDYNTAPTERERQEMAVVEDRIYARGPLNKE